MIVAVKKGMPQVELEKMIHQMELAGLQARFSVGEVYDILTLLGDTSKVDEKRIQANEWVQRVQRIGAPYKLANRLYHPQDTLISVGKLVIGEKQPIVFMAGPCSVEGEQMICQLAQEVKEAGASVLRGGVYKPRTSPYSFQGKKEEGLKEIAKAGKQSQLPIISELTSVEQLPQFLEVVDIIQIGARNMQNFELLKAVGRENKPVLLKRGLGNTIEEWLMAAEYILAEGNPNVLLCERGIRTFEKYTRATLDLSAIPVLKEKTHLPVIVDPSHSTGDWKWVESMSLAAIAAGADGLLIEVHANPEEAWSDGQQSLRPDRFKELTNKAKLVANAIGRDIYEG